MNKYHVRFMDDQNFSIMAIAIIPDASTSEIEAFKAKLAELTKELAELSSLP